MNLNPQTERMTSRKTSHLCFYIHKIHLKRCIELLVIKKMSRCHIAIKLIYISSRLPPMFAAKNEQIMNS